MSRALAIAAVLVLVGCEGDTVPPANRCEGVRCTGTDVCNPTTGSCEPRDAGASDAGGADAGSDAGLPSDGGSGSDGGLDGGAGDAGAPDAGLPDAGTPDGGLDGGSPDAGPMDAGVDAGCGSDGDCFGAASHCDPSSRECVECFLNSHCLSSVTPVCDLRDHTCQGCVGNADCANPLPICLMRQCQPCNTNAECGPGLECDPLLSGNCLALPDSCANPKAILPSGLGTTSFSAEPGQAIDDTAGTCNASGPELVYRFTTSQVRDLTVSVTAQTGSAARPVVYLRGPSCSAGPQTACDAPASGAASLAIANLPAGDWFLFVESANGAPGRVTVQVSLLSPALPPTNESCAAPQALVFSGQTAVAVGNTTLAANDSTTATNDPSCSATARTSGKDLLYSYAISTRSNVTVVARPVPGSSLHPVVSVRTACGTPSTEVGCQAQTVAAAAQVTLNGQLPGTYFVWVDSGDGTDGAFQLEVTARPAVDNDTCSGVQTLTFTGNTATATGDTTYATNGNVLGDQTPSCSDSARGTGRDVLYSFTLTQPRDVTVAVTPTGASPTFQPVVSVRTACTDAARTAEKGCVSPLAPTQGALTLVNQPAGTYVVWVDGSLDTAGPFQLEVATAPPTPPPANDSCTAPQALSFVAGVATVSSSTLQAANDNNAFDVSPTCSSTARQTGRDVVYSMTLSAPQDVTLTVTPASGSTLNPVLYVRKAACNSQLLADELVCLQKVGPVSTTLTALAAGTYWIWVDGAGGTSGNFTLTATQAPPTPTPANDGCGGAQALTFVGDTATVTGTTVGATNVNSPTDNAPACGASFFPRRFGRDLVYTYTLTGAQDVDIRVMPTSGSLFVPTVYVRLPGQCASFSAGSEVACMAQTQSAEARLYLPNQAAGTYPLFVDSNSYETGGFTLTVRKLPATLPPANDTCAGPGVVTAGATGVMGDTTAARDDYSISSTPNYSSACRTYFFSGRDLTYQYTATATGTVTARVAPQGLFDPALMLLQPMCGAASCVRFSDSGGAGVPESFTFSVTQGQTYYLVVDSWDGEQPNTFGAFTLTVQ
ncbi:MAG: hypothetical protein AB1938_18815 [Myxococcota bacterium]